MTQKDKTNSVPISNIEKRSYPRRYIDNYPITIKKTDSTKIKATITNLSLYGIQIQCSQVSAFILTTRKVGVIVNNNIPDVEVLSIFPFKNDIRKINAICKLKYSAMGDDVDKNRAFTIGLEVINHKSRSLEVVKELLEGRVLPYIRSAP